MPYRHAHWIMLALLTPAVLVAFWPAYFGRMASAPFAFHAHGLTASAWLLLVGAQSWSIHHRRHALHRSLGRAVFVVVPLFAGGAVVAMCSMATKFVTASDPFYAAMGPVLGLHDLITTAVFVAMVRLALVHRRSVALHAGYLLGTVLLVLPPIYARLPLPIPRWIPVGELTGIAIALALLVRTPKSGRPWLIVAATMMVQIVQVNSFGRSDAWASLFARLAEVPAVPLGLVVMAGTAAMLWPLWPRPAKRPAVA